MIIPDFLSTKNKIITVKNGLLFFVSLCAVFFSCYDFISLYEIIEEFNEFICGLLGFTLASYTVFLSNESKIKETKSFRTEKKVGNKKISLYRLICIDFSILLLLETVMCIFYYVSKIFNPICGEYMPKIVADLFNGIYVFAFFYCICMTIHAINDMYNIASKE